MSSLRKLLLLLAIGATTVISCNKTKSPDKPLPKIYKPSVLVGCDNNMFYSLDAQTGSKNWEFQTDGGVESSACLYKNVAYFGSNGGKFYAVNANTGKLLWVKQLNAPIKSSACIGNDKIYFGSDNDTLYCLDLNGNDIWKYDMEGAIICSPL